MEWRTMIRIWRTHNEAYTNYPACKSFRIMSFSSPVLHLGIRFTSCFIYLQTLVLYLSYISTFVILPLFVFIIYKWSSIPCLTSNSARNSMALELATWIPEFLFGSYFPLLLCCVAMGNIASTSIKKRKTVEFVYERRQLAKHGVRGSWKRKYTFRRPCLNTNRWKDRCLFL